MRFIFMYFLYPTGCRPHDIAGCQASMRRDFILSEICKPFFVKLISPYHTFYIPPKFILRSNKYGKLSKISSRRELPMAKFLSLLLCLLLLPGCAAPAAQEQVIPSPTVSPIAALTVAPTVAPAPQRTSMPKPKIPVANTDDYGFQPGSEFPLQETENVYYLWPAKTVISPMTGVAVNAIGLGGVCRGSGSQTIACGRPGGGLASRRRRCGFSPLWL